MTIKDVIILTKLSVFVTLGMLIQGGLGLFFSLLILPDLKQNVNYIFYEHYSQLGFTFFSFSLIFGVALVMILGIFLSYFLSFKLIHFTVGWDDVKEKFPKIF